MTCPRCGAPIKPGQLYLAGPRTHVACPTPRQIARDRWRVTALCGAFRLSHDEAVALATGPKPDRS